MLSEDIYNYLRKLRFTEIKNGKKDTLIKHITDKLSELKKDLGIHRGTQKDVIDIIFKNQRNIKSVLRIMAKAHLEGISELSVDEAKILQTIKDKGAGGNLDVKPDEDKVRIEFIKPTTDMSLREKIIELYKRATNGDIFDFSTLYIEIANLLDYPLEIKKDAPTEDIFTGEGKKNPMGVIAYNNHDAKLKFMEVRKKWIEKEPEEQEWRQINFVIPECEFYNEDASCKRANIDSNHCYSCNEIWCEKKIQLKEKEAEDDNI